MTTTRPPAEVWLQWHGNGDPADGDPEPGTVTWHPEPVYDSDVGPYVLATGMRERADAAERELRDLRDEVAHLKRVVGLRQKALGDARKALDDERRARVRAERDPGQVRGDRGARHGRARRGEPRGLRVSHETQGTAGEGEG